MSHSIAIIQASGKNRKATPADRFASLLSSRTFTQKVLIFAREHGFVETISGRRRYLPHINNADDSTKRNQAERQAINTTVQGSAADIAKRAMLRMERNIQKYRAQLKVNRPNEPSSNVYLVLHMHDELMYEVPAEKSKQIAKILRSSMENCANLNVPLKVKLKMGRSWGDLQPIECSI